MFFKKKAIEKQFVSSELKQIYIELSTHCNLSCKTCVRNSVVDFQPVHVSTSLMERIVDSLSEIKTAERIVLLGYGEALCNPYIDNLLHTLGKTGIPLVLVTNGHFVSEKVIQMLVSLPVHEVFFSVDDLASSNSNRIRTGADISLVWNNFNELKKAKERLNSPFPKIGLEVVALKRNAGVIQDIIQDASIHGAERCIVTNIFPYSEEMMDEILYAVNKPPSTVDLKRILRRERGKIEIADQSAHKNRCCPFIEKGTAFITAEGNVAPCFELAHTHKAFYFGLSRPHYQYYFGSLLQNSLHEIWNNEEVVGFRDKFTYFDFPNCLDGCTPREKCYARSEEVADCYSNYTPCGECLWARGIIRCP